MKNYILKKYWEKKLKKTAKKLGIISYRATQFKSDGRPIWKLLREIHRAMVGRKNGRRIYNL